MPMSPRLLRPRATGFNPKSISGLKLWLDVANTSSLTFNGSTVSQVNDLSGNGFHATQGTANNQPTLHLVATAKQTEGFSFPCFLVVQPCFWTLPMRLAAD